MFKWLRIISCIISALCLAGCPFAFIYAGIIWGICALVGAIAFAALTFAFRAAQRDKEKKDEGEVE